MDDLNYLREQQRLLLAEKAEKERKLAELMKGTKQSKPKGKLRNSRSAKNDEEFDFSNMKFTSPYAKPNIPNTSIIPPEIAQPSNLVYLDENQFEDLRTEHKKNRALVREQFKEYQEYNQFFLARIDYLQQNVDAIMSHLGIKEDEVVRESEGNARFIPDPGRAVDVQTIDIWFQLINAVH